VLQGTENRELSICKNCDVHLQEIVDHLQGANVSLSPSVMLSFVGCAIFAFLKSIVVFVVYMGSFTFFFALYKPLLLPV
jgi:hypothetical protein